MRIFSAASLPPLHYCFLSLLLYKQLLKQAVVFHAFYPFCLLKDLDLSISVFWDKSSKLANLVVSVWKSVHL